ncbi:MAG: hypothetical protein IJ723_08160 [Ruminococcus sp.]|nr:hypothetical protein [Ruminococcus sp.]
MNETKAYKVHMGAAKCAVDLGDGSERGEYVNQDYILHKLGRPHRGISLMYCYYPLDKEFPARISEACKDMEVSFAWDYPYDDYFTYKGGLNGTTDDEPFTYMRDVRRHGQEVVLTLTIDPNVSDEHLIAIANDLKPFGRMLLRINHEATGNWFSFTKRATYAEIAQFYCRFHNILKEYAPNVTTILCACEINDATGRLHMEDEFLDAFKTTDIWSIDKYFALHWGWPYDVAERNNGGDTPSENTHSRSKIKDVYDLTKRTYKKLVELNGGVEKPMVMSELNADGDVTGPYDQAAMVKEFCDMLKADPDEGWFNAFTMYQFRDRGRLGLEIEDPNYSDCGIEQPLMGTYKEIIHDDFFKPSMTRGEELQFPVKLRWGGSEDAEGIEIPLHFDKNPHFCEVTFDDDSNLMMEINSKWFYKSPKARTIDLMSAFFEKPLEGEADLTLRIFAPPASGENDLTIEDGLLNSYSTIEKLPDIRIRFEPVEI